MDERELLRRFQQGDHLAFQEIYHRYKHRVAGNLLRMLKSQDLVEETLQELFVRIWANRKRLDVNQPIKSYLFRIAGNLVYDLFRRAARDKRLQEQLTRAIEQAYSHVEEAVYHTETESELHRVINLLPPKRRKVYVLCKLEAKSYEEVANLLHISPGTVNDHMKKANAFLKSHFSKHPEWSVVVCAALMLC